MRQFAVGPLVLVLAVVVGCNQPPEKELQTSRGALASGVPAASLPAQAVLSLDSATHFTVAGGRVTVTTTHTEGTGALALAGSWTRLTSRPFTAAGQTMGPYLAVDLMTPGPEKDPWWNGTVEARVAVPSAGIALTSVGLQSLTGRAGGVFHTLFFKLPGSVRPALDEGPGNMIVELEVSGVSPPRGAAYVVDNLRFKDQPSDDDHAALFGWEGLGHFTSLAPTSLVASPVSEGQAALAVAASGYTVLNTRSFFTGGLRVGRELLVDLFVPAQPPNTGWKGDLEIKVSSPSAGLRDRSLGRKELTPLAGGRYHTLQFAIPEDVADRLRARRSDVQLRFLLNVPRGSGIHHFDNLRVPAPPIEVERSRTIDLAPPALMADAQQAASQGTSLRLVLFSDVTVQIGGVTIVDGNGGQSVVGRLLPPHNGVAYLSIAGGRLSGVVQTDAVGANPGLDFQLRSLSATAVEVKAIDRRSYPREAEPNIPAQPGKFPIPTFSPLVAPGAATRAVAANPQHDVLVVFTPEVEAALGAANVVARINQAITQANDVYQNSGIDQRLNLVHQQRVDYTESSDFGENLDRLQDTNDGHIDEVHPLRDLHGADMVVMLVANDDQCGKANLAVISSDADDDSAFAIVNFDCVSNFSFAHELGHVSGAHHDTHADPTPLPRYAHGFVSIAGQWRTVMAYEDHCDDEGVSCPRIPFFSTPNRTNPVDGRTVGNDGWSNNVRRLNETAITLENFRLRGPRVSLYEGNGGTQDHVCVLSAEVDGAVNFTDGSDLRFCDNDEARSLRLFDLPAGRVLRFFDAPDGNNEDDWVEIRVKQPVRELLLPTLEQSFEDASVRVIYHRNNGLDGKVSRYEATSSPTGPAIDLHEGNGGTQNLVCSVGVAGTVSYHFPSHPRCDNDEARSVTLYDLPAGTVLTVFDDPDGARSDDWTEIRVKRDLPARTLATFEASFEDDELRVTYHARNGLDGKVSRVEASTAAATALVELWEGNGSSQDLVCTLSAAQPVALNFQDGGSCANDEARSLTMFDVPQGTILLFYDSPQGNREDDWTAVEALTDISSRSIAGFEDDINDGQVRVTHFHNNGLDGKVSRFEVRTASTLSGILSLYEGNGGSQNKVCDLDLVDQVVRFPSHSACDNDETRSLVMSFISAGANIQVFDDPDCTTNDDWTEITVKRPVYRKTLDSYERTFEDDDIAVVHHHDNGLDGKVSCMRIEAP